MASEGTRARLSAGVAEVTQHARDVADKVTASQSLLIDGRTQDDARTNAHAAIRSIYERGIRPWAMRADALAAEVPEPSEAKLSAWEAAGRDYVEVLDSVYAAVEDASAGRLAWQTVGATFRDLEGIAADVTSRVLRELGDTASYLRWGILLGVVVGAAVFAYVIAHKVGGFV